MQPVGKNQSSSSTQRSESKDPNPSQALPQIVAQLKNDFEAQISRAKKRKSNELSVSDIEELEKVLREKLELLEKASNSQTLMHIDPNVSNNNADDEEIKLNIGGQIFPVLKSTLLKQDKSSMFNSMFSGRYPLMKRQDGSIFIDRDPTHFGYILNYLRDGVEVALPESIQIKEEILREADFYNLQGLIWALEGKILRVKELGPVNIAIKAEEDKIRKLFLDNPQHELLKNPYIHLVDVYDPKNVNTFVFQSPSEVEATLPLVFEWQRWTGFGSSIHPNKRVFQNQWNRLCPLLKDLNWNNIVAAGGSVLGALMKFPPKTSKAGRTQIGWNLTFLELLGGDVDLFLWGLDEAGARKKIQEIFDCVRKNKKQPIVVVRTSRTITFVCGHPQRHIQIILRLYRNPAEVLLGFDLDCCCFMYDGNRVWALPRGRRAVNQHYNIADPTRQTFRTTSYEYRLWKYSRRSFAVAVPGFKRYQVNRDIFSKEFEDLKGFAKLLFLEEKDFRIKNERKRKLSNWFELNDASLDPKKDPNNNVKKGSDDDEEEEEDEEWEFVQAKESKKKFAEVTKPGSNGFPEMTSLTEVDVVGSVIDYNNGVLLPFSEITTTHGIFNRLTYKTFQAIKGTPEGQSVNLYYTFGWDLEQAMDASKFHILAEVKRDFNLHVPKQIEFIGSLAQYIQSLPAVEEDWFAEGLIDHKNLDMSANV